MTAPVANLRKRSILLAGHATSVALEPEFWSVLEHQARIEGLSLSGLMSGIDRERGDKPLASACRLAALAFALERGLGNEDPEGEHESDAQDRPDDGRD
jgi:predicted DNA-binding ribbon-helix-helix protein